MFFRLEISIYYIQVTPLVILKTSLDYNFHILMYVVGLDYISILFLCRSTKYLFCLFTPPLLPNTYHSIYTYPIPRTFCSYSKDIKLDVWLRKLPYRPPFSSLIRYIVLLKNLFDSSRLDFQRKFVPDLSISMLGNNRTYRRSLRSSRSV